jgi:hypothetical protein
VSHVATTEPPPGAQHSLGGLVVGGMGVALLLALQMWFFIAFALTRFSEPAMSESRAGFLSLALAVVGPLVVAGWWALDRRGLRTLEHRIARLELFGAFVGLAFFVPMLLLIAEYWTF